jgi:hypothetical protein
MVALPLIKLVGLAVKQISKPVANALKNSLKNNIFCRNRIFIPVGRAHHRMQETIARSSISSKVRLPIRDIDEDKAMLIGAEFIGEAIIYAVAVAVLVMETVKSSKRASEKETDERMEALKEQKMIDEHERMMEELRELKVAVVALQLRQEADEEFQHTKETNNEQSSKSRCDFSKKL